MLTDVDQRDGVAALRSSAAAQQSELLLLLLLPTCRNIVHAGSPLLLWLLLDALPFVGGES